MYPYIFHPQIGFVDLQKVFVAMPFADQYEPIFKDLIVPSIQQVNKGKKKHNQLKLYRAKDPKYTRSGWLEILENLFTARVVIGVLTGNNPNVFYELGIAHATQQIERQLLLAEKGYEPKFDLKDLIFVRYNPTEISVSIPDLATALRDTLNIYDIANDRMVSLAESRLSFYEFDVITRYGNNSHFILPKNGNLTHYEGLTHLCHAGLLRLSARPDNGKIVYSYYWTDLGNAVLHRLKIINEEVLKQRMSDYHKVFIV